MLIGLLRWSRVMIHAIFAFSIKSLRLRRHICIMHLKVLCWSSRKASSSCAYISFLLSFSFLPSPSLPPSLYSFILISFSFLEENLSLSDNPQGYSFCEFLLPAEPWSELLLTWFRYLGCSWLLRRDLG